MIIVNTIFKKNILLYSVILLISCCYFNNSHAFIWSTEKHTCTHTTVIDAKDIVNDTLLKVGIAAGIYCAGRGYGNYLITASEHDYRLELNDIRNAHFIKQCARQRNSHYGSYRNYPLVNYDARLNSTLKHLFVTSFFLLGTSYYTRINELYLALRDIRHSLRSDSEFINERRRYEEYYSYR